MKKVVRAEYIWIDGSSPTQKLRSKTRIISETPPDKKGLEKLEARYSNANEFPEWGFDGSSTNQSPGENSDLILKPIRFVPDPTRDSNSDFLVLCEVLNTDSEKTPHASNTRAGLVEMCKQRQVMQTWFGFEQEYTLYSDRGRPLGWPDRQRDFPAPQGGFYCGVGADEVFGRDVVEEHIL